MSDIVPAMMLGLQLQPSLRLVQWLECDTCGQVIDSDKSKEDLTEAALFGAKKYSICIVCQQKVEKPTKKYKQKWDKWAKKLA